MTGSRRAGWMCVMVAFDGSFSAQPSVQADVDAWRDPTHRQRHLLATASSLTNWKIIHDYPEFLVSEWTGFVGPRLIKTVIYVKT